MHLALPWHVLIWILLAFPGASQAQTQGRTGAAGVRAPLPTDQIIVRMRSVARAGSAAPAAARQLGERSGVALVHSREMGDGAQVLKLPSRIPAADIAAVVERLKADPDVEFAEPDGIRRALLVPNDTYYSTYQWHYFDPVGGINLPAAWNITTGSNSVVVAVVDTGVRAHADLAGRLLTGFDFISDTFVSNDGGGRDTNATDPGDWEPAGYCAPGSAASNSSWHGTHVAGTIGAVTNNGTGVAGVTWSSRILPARVLGRCGGYTSDIVDAVRWSAGLPVAGVALNTNPARVINLSLGGTGPCSTTEQAAFNAVAAAGAVVVIAAGNEAEDASGASPANCTGVITVAATSKLGDLASYSNFGAIVAVSAPGGDSRFDTGVLSTVDTGTQGPVGDGYGFKRGTSMATPHVAGVAALMLAINPALTAVQVKSLLRSTARPFAAGTSCATFGDCGTGIVDAAAALAAAAPAGASVAFQSAAVAVSEAAGSVTLTVVRSGSTTGTATVNYTTAAGSASAGSDFTPTSGTLAFNPGVTTRTLSVPIQPDAVLEGTESFTVVLSNPTGAALGTPSVATVSIQDATSTLQFQAATLDIDETAGTALLTVTRTGNSTQAASVNFASANGTATAGQDYTAVIGSVSFAAGETSRTIAVPITNDTLVEGSQTFSVTLSNPTGATLGSPSVATVTILDTGNTVQFESAAASVSESAGSVAVNVTRAGSAANVASVAWSTSPGSAQAGADFTSRSGTLAFAAGETVKTISVPILADAIVEGDETFTISLASPAGTALGTPATTTVTITAAASPSPFAFADRSGVAPRALVVSGPITVSGVTGSLPVSVSGGSYSVDGAAFTSAAGSVLGGQTIRLAVRAPAGYRSAGSATLTVAGVSGSFSVFTGGAPSEVSGDSASDVVWFDPGARALSAWLGGPNGYSGTTALGTVGSNGWTPIAVADCNGDGYADIVWRHTNGSINVWLMRNGSLQSGSGFVQSVGAGWSLVGAADFNADGNADLLWRHESTGALVVWFLQGASLIGSASLPTQPPASNWIPLGLADVDGDGVKDIVWRNTATSAVNAWRMQGTTVLPSSGPIGFAGPEWTFGAAGDLDGDGTDDLVWVNLSGAVNAWFMSDGSYRPESGQIATAGTPWSIALVADLNGDGRADLLWRSQGGDSVAWLMNGSSLLAAPSLPKVDPALGPVFVRP